MHICTYKHINTCLYTDINISAYENMYISTYVHMNTYTCIDMHKSTYVDLILSREEVAISSGPPLFRGSASPHNLSSRSARSHNPLFKGDFKMRSKTKRNSKNHFQSYKSLDQILSEISDPEELLEVQEFLETPIDELPEEVTSIKYFRRFAD